MAHFRASFNVVQRSSGGSSVRRSAYARCDVAAEFDFTSKASEFVSGEVLLPDGADLALMDPTTLWSAVEATETRINSQTARTLEFAIPNEIPKEEWPAFAHALLTEFTDLGFAVEYAIHDVEALFEDGPDAPRNGHIHAAVTMRTVAENGFNKIKDRVQNTRFKASIIETREHFATIMNGFMSQRGILTTVDHRTKAESNPDEPRIPIASAGVRGAYKRYKENKAAGKSVELPEFVAEYLEQRAEAIAAIKEFREALANLTEVENSQQQQKKEIPHAENQTDAPHSGRAGKTDQRSGLGGDATQEDGNSSGGESRPHHRAAGGPVEIRRGRTDPSPATRDTVINRKPGGTSGTGGIQPASVAPSVLASVRRNVSRARLNNAARELAPIADYMRSMNSPPTDFASLTGDDQEAAMRFLRNWASNYQAARPGM